MVGWYDVQLLLREGGPIHYAPGNILSRDAEEGGRLIGNLATWRPPRYKIVNLLTQNFLRGSEPSAYLTSVPRVGCLETFYSD